MSAGRWLRVTVCCKGQDDLIGFTRWKTVAKGSRCLKPNQIETSANRLTKVLYFYTTMLYYVNL
jgi:hypothetical protein